MSRRRTGRSESGSSRPARIRSRVDLPDPLAPTTPMRASSATSRSSPSSTRRAPNDLTPSLIAIKVIAPSV